jgi:hypothetical protein
MGDDPEPLDREHCPPLSDRRRGPRGSGAEGIGLLIRYVGATGAFQQLRGAAN